MYRGHDIEACGFCHNLGDFLDHGLYFCEGETAVSDTRPFSTGALYVANNLGEAVEEAILDEDYRPETASMEIIEAYRRARLDGWIVELFSGPMWPSDKLRAPNDGDALERLR